MHAFMVATRAFRLQAAQAQTGSHPTLAYEPTYQLDPERPFDKILVQKIIADAIEGFMPNYLFERRKAPKLAQNMSEEIKNRVKMCKFDRYKIICYVVVGEKLMQSYVVKSGHIWHSDRDGLASYVYDQDANFFLLATVYAIYYE